MRRCPICGGELKDTTITRPQEYEGKIIILENLPAEVCAQCGEVFLHPDVLERVQAIVWSKVTPKRMTSVPVFDLAEAS
ncbi:MAG: type II toxin-antitoxin system MqsA family antitoxin [Chloroflexi bacterium]|nr:type II toxin-antitoxin system MqsA family antitoxin [Chloroflexota bacterium]